MPLLKQTLVARYAFLLHAGATFSTYLREQMRM